MNKTQMRRINSECNEKRILRQNRSLLLIIGSTVQETVGSYHVDPVPFEEKETSDPKKKSLTHSLSLCAYEINVHEPDDDILGCNVSWSAVGCCVCSQGCV